MQYTIFVLAYVWDVALDVSVCFLIYLYLPFIYYDVAHINVVYDVTYKENIET